MGTDGHCVCSVNDFQMPTMFIARLDAAGDAKMNKFIYPRPYSLVGETRTHTHHSNSQSSEDSLEVQAFGTCRRESL